VTGQPHPEAIGGFMASLLDRRLVLAAISHGRPIR